MHLTSHPSPYASLHSRMDGLNWALHYMPFYFGLNSALIALYLSPSEHFHLGNIV